MQVLGGMLGLLLLAAAVIDIRFGAILSRLSPAKRAEQPAMFWSIIGIQVVAAVALIFYAFGVLKPGSAPDPWPMRGRY